MLTRKKYQKYSCFFLPNFSILFPNRKIAILCWFLTSSFGLVKLAQFCDKNIHWTNFYKNYYQISVLSLIKYHFFVLVFFISTCLLLLHTCFCYQTWVFEERTGTLVWVGTTQNVEAIFLENFILIVKNEH